jgi:hypothetical protein
MYISAWCSKHQTKAMGVLWVSSERVIMVSQKTRYLQLNIYFCLAQQTPNQGNAVRKVNMVSQKPRYLQLNVYFCLE